MCHSVGNVPVANLPYCCKYALLLQMCQLPTIPKFFKILENILTFPEKLREMLSGRVSNVGGVTGVLRIAEIGLFWGRKCGNQSLFLRIADIG